MIRKEHIVTLNQHEYIMKLKDGPKTTHDLVLEMMVCQKSISKMMNLLRKKGIVKTRFATGIAKSTRLHELTATYEDLNLKIKIAQRKSQITDEEILYAGILRNANMTGQQLMNQFRKKYPHRPEGGIKNIVTRAKKANYIR